MPGHGGRPWPPVSVTVSSNPAAALHLASSLPADPPAATRMGARGRRHVWCHRSYERLAASVKARYLALVPPGGPGAPRRGVDRERPREYPSGRWTGNPPALVDCARILAYTIPLPCRLPPARISGVSFHLGGRVFA